MEHSILLHNTHKPEITLLLSDCGVIVIESTPSIGVWRHLWKFKSTTCLIWTGDVKGLRDVKRFALPFKAANEVLAKRKHKAIYPQKSKTTFHVVMVQESRILILLAE